MAPKGYQRRKNMTREKMATKKSTKTILVTEEHEETMPKTEQLDSKVEPSTKKEINSTKGKQPIIDTAKDVKFPIYLDTFDTTGLDGAHIYNELYHLIKDGKGTPNDGGLNEREEQEEMIA
jgi:hypothetical protein